MNDNLSLSPWVGGFEEKPDWTTFFLAESFLTAQKSIDTSTVHGCVWVDRNNKILSKGYNGPLRGSDDKTVPMTRPIKYFLLLHSEENCLLNYSGSLSDTEGSTMYISGSPCHRCLRMMLQKGIRRIVHGPVNSHCVDAEDMAAKESLLSNTIYNDPFSKDFVSITEVKDMRPVVDLLLRTISYIQYKCPDALSK